MVTASVNILMDNGGKEEAQLARRIPNSDEGRREMARKQRQLKTIGKAGVIGLGTVTMGLIAYVFTLGL